MPPTILSIKSKIPLPIFCVESRNCVKRISTISPTDHTNCNMLSDTPFANAPTSFAPAFTAPGKPSTTMERPSESNSPNFSMAPSRPPSWNAVVSSDTPFVPNCTNSRNAGVRLSDIVICALSNADLNSVISPVRLSNCVAAICAAAPCASRIDSPIRSQS